MARHQTDPGYTCSCQYCVHHIARLDAKLEHDVEEGKETANDVRRLEGRVSVLEHKRAHSEGAAGEREKARDWVARILGTVGAGGAGYEILSRLLGGG